MKQQEAGLELMQVLVLENKQQEQGLDTVLIKVFLL